MIGEDDVFTASAFSMIRIVVVDDEEEEITMLCEYLRDYCGKSDLNAEILTYTNPIVFLEKYRGDCDLIFMDIEMPDMDGIEVCRRIRQFDDRVPIVFVTNMKKLAIRGYEVNALDFVVKPVNYFAFELTLKKALRYMFRRGDQAISVPVKAGVRRIDIAEIRYIEMVARKLVFHVRDEQIESHGTLKDYEKRLYEDGFRRCNNCYLVNVRYVTGYCKDTVSVGGDVLQISRPKKKEFLYELTNCWGAR